MRDQDEPRQRTTEPEVPGVIDTIGLAYTRLLARPWIILGPVILDLYLWLGLKITAGPLALKLADAVRSSDGMGASAASFFEDQSAFNLAELLSLQLFTIRMPTFLPLLVSEQSVRLSSWKPELDDGPWWLLAGLLPVLLLGGFAIGAAFLLMLGDVARDRSPRVQPERVFRTGYRLLFWIVASGGLLALLAWPVLVAQGAFIYAGVGTIGILALLVFIPAGLGFVLFFFSAYAIVLDGTTAVQGFRSSYRIVRAYGWQSLAFVVSYMVMTGGFPFVWRLMIDVPPGTLIAIIGNAFISTGMIAAGMIYYEDRAAIVGPGEPVAAKSLI